MRKLLVTVLMLLCFPLMAQVLQPLGSGLPARVVASYAAGNEYLALFEQAPQSGDKIYTVARWNGTYWTYYTGGLKMPLELPKGSSYNYHSVVLYHDTMYVGANIPSAEASSNVTHLYKWDGSIWQPVQNSVSSTTDGILAMTVFKDRLIVAGRFQSSVAGKTSQNIVAYDGKKWEYLGDNSGKEGTDGSIKTLVTGGNRLYIGGKFRNFNGDYTGNIAFYSDANGGWGGNGSPFYGGNAEILELASFNNSIAALGLNAAGNREIRIFSNGTWSAPLEFDTFSLAEPTTIAGAGGYLLIGGKFEKGGNASSLLRLDNGGLYMTGARINGDFSLGQRGSEAFVWGEFSEQNTGIHNISKIETSYGDVVGNLFFDKNQDCVKNGIEFGLKSTMLRFEDEGDNFWFAVTDSTGHFAIALPEGNYSIEAMTGRHWLNYCPTNYAVNVRKGMYSSVSLGMFIPANLDDAEVKLTDVTPSVVKPGDQVHLQVLVKNQGSNTLNGPTVQLKHDTRLLNFKSTPAADNYNAATGEVTYTLVDLPMGEERLFDIILTIPNNALPTDFYKNTLTTGTLFTGSDVYALDNFDTAFVNLQDKEIGSVVKTSDLGGDVNYKIISLGYKVKFTNLSQSLVQRVVVLDTLDKNVIIKKVQVTGLSPKGTFRLENGILVAEFPDANLTNLESDPSASSGYITYNVVLKYQLQHGDMVYNRATADFDSKWKGSSNTVAVRMVDPNKIGIKNVKGNIGNVYPNPANTYLKLDFKLIQTGMLEVFDNTGRLVLTQKLQGYNAEVNVAGLNPGLYLVKTADGSALVNISR